MMFGFAFIGSFLLVLGMTLAGQGDTEAVKQVLSDFMIGEIMLTIVLFYFGGGAFEGVTAKIREKKLEKKPVMPSPDHG
jgi:hypothetical protein